MSLPRYNKRILIARSSSVFITRALARVRSAHCAMHLIKSRQGYLSERRHEWRALTTRGMCCGSCVVCSKAFRRGVHSTHIRYTTIFNMRVRLPLSPRRAARRRCRRRGVVINITAHCFKHTYTHERITIWAPPRSQVYCLWCLS